MSRHLSIPLYAACIVSLLWGPVGGLFAFFAALAVCGAAQFLGPFRHE